MAYHLTTFHVPQVVCVPQFENLSTRRYKNVFYDVPIEMRTNEVIFEGTEIFLDREIIKSWIVDIRILNLVWKC